MIRRLLLVLGLPLLVSGCFEDSGSPRDTTPPAAPRSLYSVTGDHEVTLRWTSNTESDLVGYRVYMAPCPTGGDCPYDRVGFTAGTSFDVTGLTNGTKQWFAVAALDRAGNESDLTYENVSDVPRPAGSGRTLADYVTTPRTAGWDFSQFTVRAWDDPATDIFYGFHRDASGTTYAQIFVPDYATEIQDAGYAGSLDAVDYAPAAGWSPSGAVEAIVGHCYVVQTRDHHYAKLQVTSVTPGSVTMDWAYQTAQDERELAARPADGETPAARRPIVWLR
jgi:hypothetical protein